VIRHGSHRLLVVPFARIAAQTQGGEILASSLLEVVWD
jgi:hypothetical protein